jgi:two-component system phosphate regulon sensor histidine kinase PhoR
MNRQKFIGLIFMMLFSIIGIIWVQLKWIRSAVGIRNDSFNHAVIASLHQAADDIEQARRMNFFNNSPFPGLNIPGITRNNLSGFSSESTLSLSGDGNFSVRITNQSVTQAPGKEPVVVIHDTTITSDISSSVKRPDDNPGSIAFEYNADTAAKKVGRVYVQQKEFVEWVRRRSNEFQNMSDRMISEVYQWEKTMEMDPREIEFALKRSLIYANIRTPFEFAVIKNGEVSEGTYKKSGRNDFLKSNYMVRLFPDNIIRQDLLLAVVFPERTNYILGSMAWILGGSLLFSLIILATFAMSLYFIIRQKKISEMKSDFINNMTHEFKTPIATISLAADTIANPKVINDESRIMHFISMIKKENSRMNKKVETILQIASLDKKEIDFKFETISLHSIIEKAVDTIEILVHQRSGSVKMDFRAEDFMISGDADHLFNLVNNLLDNAIKYSEGPPDVTVRTINRDGGIVMSVEDKGIGMSKSVQAKIFERFYRQTSGNIHDVKGFGLGLNYARSIVEAHKGNINVSSEPGKGSTFDVYLPFNCES